MGLIHLQPLQKRADTPGSKGHPPAPSLHCIAGVAQSSHPVTLFLSGWPKAPRQTKTLQCDMTFQGLRDHRPEAKVRPVFGLAFGRGDSFYHTLPHFLLFVGLAHGMLASAWAASTETAAGPSLFLRPAPGLHTSPNPSSSSSSKY